MVQQIYRARRRRGRHLSAELFGEPCWDMLLDLFAAHFDGAQICVSSLCIAAGVPSTTALRHLALLEKHALVVRRTDTADRRRVIIALTATGLEATRRALLAFIPPMSGLVGDGEHLGSRDKMLI